MKRRLLSVAAARARILKGVPLLRAETIPASVALGRTLRKRLKAARPSPATATSAMDGYAVRSAELRAIPFRLKVVGESAAGKPFKGPVKKGQTVRIFTGAPVPPGADTVVIQENTESSGRYVKILKRANRGANIRKRGMDYRKGEILAARGQLIGPRQLGLLTAANIPRLLVAKRPKVALIATGNELSPAGKRLRHAQIVDSNTPMLKAVLEANGAEVLTFGIVRDAPRAIRNVLKRAKKADLIITMGGASVGKYDFVQRAIRAEGGRLDFWKVAVKPGKPLMFGRLGRARIIGLPGNPASTFVCAHLFALPALFKMIGRTALLPPSIPATAGRPLPKNGERESYLFATLSPSPAGWIAVAFAVQDSSHLKSLARGECLIRRPPFAPALPKGGNVLVYPLFS